MSMFMSSHGKLSELINSNNRFSSKMDKCSSICGHQGGRIRQQHDACNGIRFQSHPPALFERKGVLRSDLSHRSARFLRIMRNRFA